MPLEAFVAAIALGNCSGSIKLLDAALADAAQSPDGQKQLVPLLLNRGACYQRVLLHRKALKDFDEVLRLMPDNVRAMYKKGQALTALNRSDDAHEVWTQALAVANSTSDIDVIMDLVNVLKDSQAAAQAPPNANGVSSSGGAAGGALPNGQATTASTTTANGSMRPPQAPSTPTQAAGGAASAAAKAPPGAQPVPAPSAASRPTAASSPAAQPPQPAAKLGTSAGTAVDTNGVEVTDIDCVASQQANRHWGAPFMASSKASPAGPRPAPSSPAKAPSPATTSAPAAAASGGAKPTPTLPLTVDPTAAIQAAVEKINSGDVENAEELLNGVLASRPRELGALVARGTARAMRRDLKGAVQDFSVAIEVEPRYADSYKRRGQARSAIGPEEHQGALADLQKAIDLLPLWQSDTASSRAECYMEKGMVYQKMRDYRKAACEVEQAVKLDPKNPQAWNTLGLCRVSQGDIREGVDAYNKATELNPKLKEAWINMAQALKEEGRSKEAERAFLKVLALDTPETPSVHALRIMGQMRQQRGEHSAAIKVLDKVIAHNRDDQMIESLYQRAICYHALGHMREAVRDYEACLGYTVKQGANVSEEARGFQFLSFYQKEMALFLYHNFERNARTFCLDAELSSLFKELWCKKGPPTGELISQYNGQHPVPSHPPSPPPPPDAARLRELTLLADRLGLLLQNHHQGFMSNMRQQRAAGYAAMELGQEVAKLLAARRGGKPLWVPSEGASGQGGCSGRHQFGWRDAMDIVVKWRQLAEPNDQVVWVDMLTRREFEQGFGSHTPMFSGQTKCVRYYMNFKRALELQRAVLLAEGHAFDAANRHVPVGSADQREALAVAKTAEDMYHVLKQDSWVVVHIKAVHHPSVVMEGTRLTLVKVPNQPDGYEFSIRTPVTPPRWKVFDAELEACWEDILTAMVEGDQPKTARAILTYGYYWYNFMPLARGTAAVGYTTILALFWAAGMPVTTPIPQDYQVDWEAILTQHPSSFIDALVKWLVPDAGLDAPRPKAPRAASSSSAGPEFPPMAQVPAVQEVLATLRNRLEALNGDKEPRI